MTTLGPGDRGEAVEFAQRRLKLLGFGPARATGVYGEPTQAAVRAFRKARHLPEGVILDDPAWDELLLAQSEPSPVSFADEEVPVGEGVPLPDLAFGARGEAVRLLQEALNKLGFGPLPTSSVYDSATQAAMARFQSSAGMPSDGLLGGEDWLLLFSRLSSTEGLESLIPALSETADLLNFSNERWREVSGSGGYLYRQFADGSIRVVLDPRGRMTGTTLTSGSAWLAITQEIGAFPAATPPPQSAGPAPRPTVRRGDRGEHSKAAQVRLNQLGFGPLTEDGVFGAGTETAVKAFQTLAGQAPSGVVDAACWTALLATRAPVQAGSPAAEVSKAQEKLNLLGFGPLSTDGAYGPRTSKAVASFQTQQGLPSTGVLDERSWWRLMGARSASLPAAVAEDAQTSLKNKAAAAVLTLPAEAQAKVLAALNAAIGMLGYAEEPLGSNGGPKIDPISGGYYSAAVEKTEGKPPWCALAVSHWIYLGLNAKSWADTPMGQRFGGVSQYQDWGQKKGRWLDKSVTAPAGSVIIMPRASSGSDTSTTTKAGHTGLVVRDLGDSVETIEGNVSDSVKSRTRKKADLFGFVTWW